MKRKALAWLSAFTLLNLIAPGLRADEGDRLIVAGAQVGKIVVGMDEADVGKLLGKPASTESTTAHSSETWVSKSREGKTEQTFVTLNLENSGRRTVSQVAVTSPYFHPKADVSVGSDLATIQREFPGVHRVHENVGPEGQHAELYDDQRAGIAFLIEHVGSEASGKAPGKCLAVVVHHFDAGVEPIHFGPLPQS